MKYQWMLFDADETLFSFNSYYGLKSVLARYGLDFSEQDYADFQAVNQPLWVAYQNQEISAKELQTKRFERLSRQTSQDPLQLNQELMAEMALISLPLSGVSEMLHSLHRRVKMGIITNGFHALQQKRLTNTQTSHFFDLLVVSENVGVAKPHPKIFESAFSQMGEFDKQKVLMIGDTLSSDILGGNQVGIDTCWFNPSKQPNLTEIQPTYEIHHISELIEIVRA